MKKFKFIILCLFITSLSYAQEFKYTASKSETVSFQNVYANLRIESYKGNEIIIRTQNFKSQKNDSRASGLRSAFNTEDNTGLGLKIYRDGNMIVISKSGGRYKMVDSRTYEILVPDFLKVEVLCKSKEFYQMSKVFVRNISRSFVYEAILGSLTLEDLTGPASINIESGNIEGTFSKLSQKNDTYISTMYGLIDIAIPDNTPANLYLKSPYGEVYTDFNIDYDKDASDNALNGFVSGKINGGGIRLQLKTESNNIYLRRKSRNTRIYSERFEQKIIPNDSEFEKVLAKIDKVRDDQDLSYEFKVDKEAEIHIFGIGERDSDGKLADYGFIEDALSKKKVWVMKEQLTTHAGGADKNRLVDTYITLLPGRYILRYITDDSHSYEAWNMDPPNYDFWGIIALAVIKKKVPSVDNVPAPREQNTPDDSLNSINEKDDVSKSENRLPQDNFQIEPNIGISVSSQNFDLTKNEIKKLRKELKKDKLLNEDMDEEISFINDDLLIGHKKQSPEISNKYRNLIKKYRKTER